MIVTSAGSQQARQTSRDCAYTLLSSAASTTSATTSTTAHCSLSPSTICPPLYPVYPPYIVMGISVQPLTYPPPRSDLAVPPGVVTGNRKRSSNKLLPPDVKRRARKQRHKHGDVVSSTTPDSSLLETTFGRNFFQLPAEMTPLTVEEAEVTSPLCLTVSRDKLVYDSCGALDLTVRK